MRSKLILLTLLLSMLLFMDSSAQNRPLVYDVENSGADFPKFYFPLFSELPTTQSLPDPFRWSDGRGRISNFSDWQYRRAEIGAKVQHYELGTKPAPPNLNNIEANFANNTLTITITEGENSLTMSAVITLPSNGSGPFPAVIGVGSGTGSLPSNIFTSRGIATIQYNYSQVAPWTQTGRGQGEFYKLYPDTKVGYFTAWAWGISRLIDGLEIVTLENIDLKHLAVTGCSFAGKIALFSGALDERIALTIPQESGGGGDAAWRISETLDGGREILSRAQSYGWYHEDVSQFNNAINKLPFDHHEVMAMVAPRALFILGNPTQEWLADESGYAASKAAHEVWKALGVPDRFGFSRIGDHPHCALPESQVPDVAAFVEKFLLGVDSTNTDISIHPGYTINLSKWITWTTPQLSNESSFLETASLIYPSNLQKDLETEIIFKWNKTKDAAKYFIQIATDPTFKNIAKFDSTTSDTLKSITDLLKGKKYFWRLQVENIDGLLGPWSVQWNFETFIALPVAPLLVSATPYTIRPGYYTFSWSKTTDTDSYLIQISKDPEFGDVLMSASASDTVKVLEGFSGEAQVFYWRVQAKNIAGSSPWSETSKFSTLPAPTNLALQTNAINEITLTWEDNSTNADGFIIERKLDSQTSFAILDTVIGTGTEYIDKTIEQAQSYTYRIKAYKDSVDSDYSNEVSLILVGISNEVGTPKEYSISQNYPNPFNPTTNIKFALPTTSLTKIIIYDLLGREIQTLLNKELEAGFHEIIFNASNLADGVYFYRMQAGNFTMTKKLILIK